jgi:hypothetical protein
VVFDMVTLCPRGSLEDSGVPISPVPRLKEVALSSLPSPMSVTG